MMAYLRSIFTTFILLLFSLLVIANAADYGPTPNVEKPKFEVDNKPYSTKPNYDVSKPKIGYEYNPTLEIEKPKADIDYKVNFTEPNYKVPKPKINDKYGKVSNIEKFELETDFNQHLESNDENPKPETNYGYHPSPKIEKPISETVYKLNHTKSNNEVPKLKTHSGCSPIPKNEKPKSDAVYTSNTTNSYYEVPQPKNDYAYVPTPKIEKPKSEAVYKSNLTKSDYKLPKPKQNYGYIPASKIEKSKLEPDYNLNPRKPDYEVLKTKESYKVQLPTSIGVQGIVFCKSGSNYYPIQGAVARVTCRCVNELGNETNPISVFSHATNGKGYYFATLSHAKLGSKLKINECKAYLESSPLNICKVPTNVNHGISGAPLSSYRLLENNFRLYSLPPFFYTSQAKPILNVHDHWFVK